MRARVLVVLFASCGYQPGSFHSALQSFTGEHATVGCLDVSIERRRDLPNGDVVVAFAFGNRCDHPTLVDLAAAVVRGRAAERTIDLAAIDPRREITVQQLDGRAVGNERIAYASEEAVHEVCVDAASIAHAEPAVWSCFAKTEEQP